MRRKNCYLLSSHIQFFPFCCLKIPPPSENCLNSSSNLFYIRLSMLIYTINISYGLHFCLRSKHEYPTNIKTHFVFPLVLREAAKFTLDNLSKYGHLTFRFIFYLGCYNIFQKIGPFKSKNWGQKNSFPAIL